MNNDTIHAVHTAYGEVVFAFDPASSIESDKTVRITLERDPWRDELEDPWKINAYE